MVIVDGSNYQKYNIGAKAQHLFAMKEAGMNVPDLCCIPEGEDISEEKVLEVLEEYFPGVERFAVRSSASVEDSANLSFAGQFDTYLNVARNQVYESIQNCFRSARNLNAKEYGAAQKVLGESFSMNVMIQVMIDADISGVAFTANPQGLLNEMVIVCGEGTGNHIVEDKVPVTSYYYNTTDQVYYYEKNDGAAQLSDSVFKRLIEDIQAVQALLGEYLDIEYAIHGECIYIMQARRITTLDTEHPVILDNSNIVESYPGITLPLTDSFVKEVYYGVFRGLAYRCLKNKRMIGKYEEVFRQMVGSANGRMYYKISNWYTVIKFLPCSGKIIPIWQEMLGVKNKEHDASRNDISFIQTIRTYYNSIDEFLRVQANMRKLNDRFKRVEAFFYESYRENLSPKELANLYGSIADKLLKEWDITLINDLYAFLYTGLLQNTLKKCKVDDYKSKTNQYISGITNIESMKPIRALVSLARRVAVDEETVQTLKGLNTDEAVKTYMEDVQNPFGSEMKAYIATYGDRALEELKLESNTFRSKPLLLVGKILEYCEDRDRLEQVAKNFEEGIQGISDEMIMECGWAKRKILKHWAKKAALGIKNREISRLNRSRIYGMVRSIFYSMANRMIEDGLIAQVEDIFYLRLDEVFAYADGNKQSYMDVVCNRKAEYEMYKNLPAYTRLVFCEKEYNKSHLNINAVPVAHDVDELNGTPCSNGVVEGEVVVIHDVKDVGDIRGKILVTKMTDPGWVFLLTMAKGIITEKGSLLSHTAIISRELRIPSIVGVPNVTSALETGKWIRMDGSTGKIVKIGE